MNFRFYFRFLVPFLLLLQLCVIVLGSSTGNGEKGKIKNTATGKGGGGVQNTKPIKNTHGFHKMQETASPVAAADLAGKGKHRPKTSPNVAHNQAIEIETNKAQVNKELGLISSCSVSTKEYCCKRVCQKRRLPAQFPHNSGAHHRRSNNNHSSLKRVQRAICATCLAELDDEGNCDCPDDAWQQEEEEEVEQSPPPPESDSLPEQVVPEFNYDSDSDQVVPDID